MLYTLSAPIKMKVKLLIIIFLSFQSVVAIANNKINENLSKLLGPKMTTNVVSCFERHFTENYMPYQCANNIYILYNDCFLKLGERLKSKKLSLGNILYLFKINRKTDSDRNAPRDYLDMLLIDSVIPIAPRFENSDWVYHVVLEFNGYIFDLDYTNTPKVSTSKEYFETMFDQNLPKYQEYVARVIAAKDFLENSYTLDKIVNDPENKFPLKYISEF